MRLPSVLLFSAALLLCSCSSRNGVNDTSREARTERAFQHAREQGPLALRNFLLSMPKGADLHMHLSGAVYAEGWIRAAGEDGLCVDTKELKFAEPTGKACAKDQIAAADLLAHTSNAADQEIYDQLIDAFSMRSFVPHSEWSGHDQFFATFDHFSGTSKSHTGEWVDEVATRAATQNEQYLELMETPPFGHAAAIAHQIGWEPNLPEFRQKLLAAGLDQEVDAARDEIQSALTLRNKLEKCGTAAATPACQVQVRFIYQILRGFPPEQVFAQTLLGFETISKLPEFVGINFVQPEDGYLSMHDYTLQMHMLDYLHSVYPSVHISLHAGELAPGLVPPAGLRFHIRQAIELGHAERIGHGVDVMYEDNANQLLQELAAKHIMIEINLTSNEGILGVEGQEHPFNTYRRAHVPIALSTDDEGVSRIDLTHEYEFATEEYTLSYADLKKMARTSMEHDFLPGRSLWASPDVFTNVISECTSSFGQTPSAACSDFLRNNEKAAAQWEMERRIREFEAKW